MTKLSALTSLIGLLLGIGTLYGCASQPPIQKPIEVHVPVTVPCKAPLPIRPAFVVDALPLGSGIWQQMAALRAERLQRQGFEIEMEAAIRACR